jgi:hypothetical protein
MTEGTTGVADASRDTGPESDRPLRLSHSKVKAWDDCQRLFYLQYVANRFRLPSMYAIYGLAAHRAIERDLKAVMRGAAPATLEDLIDSFHEAFYHFLLRNDPNGLLREDADRIHWFYTRGMDAVRVYREQAQPFVASADGSIRPVAVEHYLRFKHPDYPTIEYAGMLDVVTERRDEHGVLQRSMRDWKFIGKPWKGGDEHYYTQADAYLWAVQDVGVLDSVLTPAAPFPRRMIFGTFPLPYVEKRVLEDGTKEDVSPPACMLDWRATERREQNRAAYAEHVIYVAESVMEAGEHEEAYKPRTSPACGWCDMVHYCAPGLAYLKREGRPIYKPKPPADLAPALDFAQEELL